MNNNIKMETKKDKHSQKSKKKDRYSHHKKHQDKNKHHKKDKHRKHSKKEKKITISLYAISNDLDDCVHKLEKDYRDQCFGIAKVYYQKKNKKTNSEKGWWLCYMKKNKVEKSKIKYERRGYSTCFPSTYTMRCEIEFII